MLTVLIAFVFGVFVTTLVRLFHLVHTTAGAILPGVVAMLGSSFFLFRRVGKLVTPLVEEAQRHVQGGRRELALQKLREGLRFARWQPLLGGQLHMQLGVLQYVSGDLDAALAELQQTGNRPWEGPAFLACVHYKKRNDEAMQKAFERAVKTGKKESLSWTAYAWCLQARNRRDEAVAVLKRAVEKIPADARLQANLELATENKKIKVAAYGDKWSAFMLDGSLPGVPDHVPKFARGFAQRPGFRQKPQGKRR